MLVTKERLRAGVVVLLAVAATVSTALSSTLIVLGSLFLLVDILRKKSPYFDWGFLKMLALYALLSLVIAAGAEYDSTLSIKDLWSHVYRFLPLVLAMAYLKRETEFRWVLLGVMLAVFLNSVYAFGQFAQNPVLSLATRPTGFAGSYTFFANFMLMGLVVGAFILMRPDYQRREKAAVGVTMLMAVAALVLNQTRSAWLVLLILLVLGALFFKEYRRQLLGVLAVLVIAGVILLSTNPYLQDRAESITDTAFRSNQERLLMWESALMMFQDHPLLGVGQGNFGYFYNTEYISPLAVERAEHWEDGHGHPHSNLLKYLAEGGIVGLGLFLLVNLYFFYRLWKVYLRERKHGTLPYATLGLMLLFEVNLMGLVDTNFNQVPIMREVWLLVAVGLVGDSVARVREN